MRNLGICTYSVLPLFLAMIFVACDEDILEAPHNYKTFDGEPSQEITLCTSTRAPGGDYTSTTYRAQLFYRNSNGVDLYNANKTTPMARLDGVCTPYTGTYCDPKDPNPWYTPCLVDGTDFSYVEDNSAYGLKAGGGITYYMVLNSPATAYEHYDTEQVPHSETYGVQLYDKEYWGIPYYRDGEPYKHPSVSEPFNVSAYGELTSNKYVYTVPESVVLKQHLSRLYFGVRCGDALEQVLLDGVTLKNLRNNGIYDPIKKKFVYTSSSVFDEDVPVFKCSSSSGEKLTPGGTPEEPLPGETLHLTGLNTSEYLGENYTDNPWYTTILSDKYSEEQRDNRPLLSLTMWSKNGSLITADPFEIAYDYEPMKSYYYVVTVNSSYILLSAYVMPWDEVTSSSDINDYDGSDDHMVKIAVVEWDGSELTADVEPGESTTDESVPAEIHVSTLVVHEWDKMTEGGAGETSIGNDLTTITPGSTTTVAKGFYSLNVAEAGEYDVEYLNESSEAYNVASGCFTLLFYNNDPQTLYNGSTTKSLEARPYTIYVSGPGTISFTKH